MQNQDETAIDCGGSVCDACSNCTDGILNGDETAPDCGGSVCDACPGCADGILNRDEAATDCGGTLCAACPTCTDGSQNQGETAIDCGGAVCGACPACSDSTQNHDETGVDCGGTVCGACPTCSDSTQNQDETDTDCGGVCGATCLEGEDCSIDADCVNGVCATGVCTVPCSGVGLQALLVVGDLSLSAGDAEAERLLSTGIGFDVTVLDTTATTSDAAGMELVVISASVGTGDESSEFTGIGVGLAPWEAYIFDELLIAGPGAGHGRAFDQTSVDIVTPAHPMAVGLSGAPVIYSTPTIVSWGVPSSGAVVIARVAGDPTQAAVFAYETGSSLVGGTLAPARRVGLYPEDGFTGNATDAGDRLVLAGFCWAAGQL